SPLSSPHFLHFLSSGVVAPASSPHVTSSSSSIDRYPSVSPTRFVMIPWSLDGIQSLNLKNGDPELPPITGCARHLSTRLAKKGILADIKTVAQPDWYFAKNPTGTTVPTFEANRRIHAALSEYCIGVR
ncbi:hypothetical protein PFISCL1PPCAC_3341, partial [Pristionchus fissidentatus]